VLEKGWIGGGNTGRNTTVVRSNYLWDESAHLYEHALKLWESLSQELNFNVMFSQRGVLNLCHSPGEMEGALRRGVDRTTRENKPYVIDVKVAREGVGADSTWYQDWQM